MAQALSRILLKWLLLLLIFIFWPFFQSAGKPLEADCQGLGDGLHAEIDPEADDSSGRQQPGKAAFATDASPPASGNAVPGSRRVAEAGRGLEPDPESPETGRRRAEDRFSGGGDDGFRKQHPAKPLVPGCRRLRVLRYPRPVLAVRPQQHQLRSAEL